MPHSLKTVKLLLEQVKASYFRRKVLDPRQIQDAKKVEEALLHHMKKAGSLEDALQDDLDALYKALADYYRKWIGPLP